MVDHQAVVAILDKYTLDAIENPKIQRLKQRLSPYSFTTIWKRGKENAIPDDLLRTPVNNPAANEEYVGVGLPFSMRNIVIQTMTAICNPDDESVPTELFSDVFNLRKMAAENVDYTALATAIETGFGTDHAHVSDSMRQFCTIGHQLST